MNRKLSNNTEMMQNIPVVLHLQKNSKIDSTELDASRSESPLDSYTRKITLNKRLINKT
jgi:hypothetical protein